ncbi:MAG TPA: ABC transporter substrate-binding protein [Candidatus Limnocylindrales bacterium]|nr:ABC transporter substrate-binding protein [Candidatus Limnocylindrales bacterium]
MTSRTRRSSAATGAVLVVALVVAGCSGSGTPASPTGVAPSASTAATDGASATPTEQPTPIEQTAPDKVRLALDWTPNTNHLAFYVAQERGWYREASIELEVLPYGGTAPESIIAAHQAECGISFQDSLTFAAAAGAPIVSAMAILQHTAQEVAVLESSAITRPRDLDGKVYAGFGYPNEVPTLQAVIKDDGGTGVFDAVTLDTAAYEALYAKRADFVITFAAWEGLEAAQRDIPLRTFRFTDYGFPDFYQVVLACDRDWVAANPDAARRFIGATTQGLEFAAANPAEAASILVAQNPGVFDANPELPMASARFMAESGLLVDAAGKVGVQTLETWTGYSSFLFEQGLLTDADGKPLAAAPDYASLFTNELLP